MKVVYLSKLCALIVSIFLIFLIPATITVTSDPFDDTEVSISPAGTIVGPGKDFTVNVYCVPGQPIKAFEFRLSFDASIISANEVTEGDIFEGFSTFFNDGTIDNSSGTIVDIYGLILGAGNTSSPGTLASISFTSKSTTGTSLLSLYDVGITNETEYVSIAVTNGTVQVDAIAPTISDISATPSYQEISGFVNISATVTDNVAVDSVFVGITYPDDSFENISITAYKIGNKYYCNQSYDLSGLYSYKFWANDTVGNSFLSAANTFEIGDMTSPVISNVIIASSSPLDTVPSFGWVNISCDVTDNIAVNDVFVNITNPDGSWNNISLTKGSGSSYYLNSSTAFSDVGNYSYYIWADDSEDNTDASSTYDFSMPPNFDIDINGVINIVDLLQVSNLYDQTGNSGWIREDVDNNGQIQVLDLVAISNHYSEVWWE